jgi:hypothetical protein
MTVQVADEHAHDQRLVSVVKIATVIEECYTEEQRSVVRFCGQKKIIRISIKKYFLFMVRSVFRVRLFTAVSRNSLGLSKAAYDARPGAGVAETTVKILPCCEFRRTDKAMGQVYQCWWRICREINVYSRLEYHVLRFIYICDLFTDSRTYYIYGKAKHIQLHPPMRVPLLDNDIMIITGSEDKTSP